MTKNTSKTNKQNWFDNNPFFYGKDGYYEFVESMKAMAEEDRLPITLAHDEPEELTMKDIADFTKRFQKDSGLSIEFNLTSCKDCGEFQCSIIIFKSSDDERKCVCA